MTNPIAPSYFDNYRFNTSDSTIYGLARRSTSTGIGQVNGELYLVPLWHNESYFDGSGCEIIVICDPELPESVEIDDDNNIFITKEIYGYSDLMNMILLDKSLHINIGEKIFEIPISKLYMKREQYYRIKNEGLSKNKKDIYDVSDKSDIIVKIILV
jgi:hypothetical protein